MMPLRVRLTVLTEVGNPATVSNEVFRNDGTKDILKNMRCHCGLIDIKGKRFTVTNHAICRLCIENRGRQTGECRSCVNTDANQLKDFDISEVESLNTLKVRCTRSNCDHPLTVAGFDDHIKLNLHNAEPNSSANPPIINGTEGRTILV